MWELIVILPLVTILIERCLEFLDAIIRWLFFPWLQTPSSPPAMLLPRPFRNTQVVETPQKQRGWRGLLQVLENLSLSLSATFQDEDDNPPVDKIVFRAPSGEAVWFVDTLEEAEFYYDREVKFHRQRLIYYLTKYGYFLPEKVKWWQKPGRFIENSLARRTGVGYPPDKVTEPSLNFAKRLVENRGSDVDKIKTSSSTGKVEDIDQELEELQLLADYCYLRHQRTYEAFSTIIKRPLYFVLGVGLGVIIAYIFDYAGYLMVALDGQMAGMFRNPGDVLNDIWVSMDSYTYQWPSGGYSNYVNFAMGASTGAGAQPLHGFYQGFSSRYIPPPPPPRPRIEREQPSSYTIRSGGYWG